MRFQNLILFCSVLFVVPVNLSGQKKIHFKPPVVNTYLGIRSGNDTVRQAEGIQLVMLPLRVKDKNSNEYKILNYRFAYNQKGYKEDPDNGKVETIYTLFADRFNHTPLPKIWKDNIASSLQSGENFRFFEILVEDSLGRKFYAPDIHLFIN